MEIRAEQENVKILMFEAYEDNTEEGRAEKLAIYNAAMVSLRERIALQEETTLDEKDEYTDRINEYPPATQNALGIFARTFRFPHNSIPKPRKSAKSKFSMWIKQIDELKDLCEGHDFENVTGTAYRIYQESADKVIMARPASANHLYISAIQRIASDEVDPALLAGKAVVEKKETPENIVTAQDLKDFRRSS